MPDQLRANIDSSEIIVPEAREVSVVVPSYNHAPFIEKCLRSIAQQIKSPLELIVIDDGSCDESVKIIERTLKECSFPCELIARHNKGLCATLNEGFRRTRSEFFAYLGSDDVWFPEFLQERVALLRARPKAVLAYGHAYTIDARNRIIDCTRNWASYADGDARRMLLEGLAPASPTVVYRRSALARHSWNNQARLEDYELYLRLSAEGDFAFDPQVLSAWRQHFDNTSRNLMLMMNECLAAQSRVATDFGIGARELQILQRALRWRFAEDFTRSGGKIQALNLACRNLKGAPSFLRLARTIGRLLIPHALFQMRRKIQHHRAARQYEFVKI
jgi:alpha-1,3-rhamnosyltransferase